MTRREEIVKSIYENYCEDERLDRTRHGQLEYLTTMTYIHKYLNDNARILEIGAGTGRYSIALAEGGYDVTAVELVNHNLDILRHNGSGIERLTAIQGDALDLSMFGDDLFDMTLIFGPLYHLYELADQYKAIDEAIRVTKPGGVIMIAFLSVHAILFTNYLYDGFIDGLAENFTDDFRVRHFEEQLFTGFDIAEFEEMFSDKPVTWLKTVAADSVLEYGERWSGLEMDDEDFEIFTRYHLATCEVRELLGSSSHLIYICRKSAGEDSK